jgi:hypothetical protein
MRLGVLLTPGFLEDEAALSLEVARRKGWEGVTFARHRASLEGAAGSVWVPRYSLAARPELDLLVIPGSLRMSRQAQDPLLRGWLDEEIGRLQAIFLGANAAVLLSSYLQSPLSAAPQAQEVLQNLGFALSEAPWLWQGSFCTTQGHLALLRALMAWAGLGAEPGLS